MKSRIVTIECAGYVFWQLFLRLELALFEVLASAELYSYKASTLQLVNFWNLRMIQKLEALNLHILSTGKTTESPECKTRPTSLRDRADRLSITVRLIIRILAFMRNYDINYV